MNSFTAVVPEVGWGCG